MTIIIGLITKSSALVASDGRILSGAYYEGDIQKRKSTVESDEFDKTFSLKNGKIIGAISGLMRFQDKTTIEHIKSIAQENYIVPYSLDKLANCICKELKSGLVVVSDEEILFQFRSLDLILIGHKSDLDLTYQIKSCRIKASAKNRNIDYTIDTIDPVINNHVYWQLFGDESSQSKVHIFLNREIGLLNKQNINTLRPIAYKAIRLGIKHSMVSIFGDHQTCGGKVYVKNAI